MRLWPLPDTNAARLLRAAFVLAAAWSAACGGEASTNAPTLRFIADSKSPAYGGVEVTSVRSRAAVESLLVWVGDTAGLPMLGTRSLSGDTLRFVPRFTPMAGARYFARFADDGLRITGDWRAPSDSGASTTVVSAVYPSADGVPMNLLRMYVEFSAPMSTGRVWDFVKLYQGDSLLDEPFYTAGGTIELWDADKRRLTVLFDPGRIKRDLKPNEERGLPLREGKSYRLVIDQRWPDAAGRPMKAGHVKQFRVGGMDRGLVRVAEWRVTAPPRTTRSALVIAFPEALDRALLDRMLVVRDWSGSMVTGTTVVSANERRWMFTPAEAWLTGDYHIEVNTELEDLAGNNLRKLFDVAPGDSAAIGANAERVRVPFVVR